MKTKTKTTKKTARKPATTKRETVTFRGIEREIKPNGEGAWVVKVPGGKIEIVQFAERWFTAELFPKGWAVPMTSHGGATVRGAIRALERDVERIARFGLGK